MKLLSLQSLVLSAVLLIASFAPARSGAQTASVTSVTAALPANISGIWLWRRIKSDGTVGKNYFMFEQAGATFSGKMEFAWGGTSDIVEGSVEGNLVRFKRKGMPPPIYAGTIEGDRMHLTGGENGASDTMELVRLPAGTPMFPTPPVRPALHTIAGNGLLKTPPMGWNAWNHFKQTINDNTVREIVESMISSGMRDAGYIYVNIDDEWAGERDSQGNIHPNRNFPDMKALADYVHSKGMKLGLYSSPGPETCEGHQGSMGYEEQDARSYSSWGVDYLKYDWCSAAFVYKDADMRAVYQKMGDALAHADRPIAYSLCQYGKVNVPQWGPLVGGNLWRTTQDISDNWKSMYWIWTEQQRILEWNKPGGWNDPDMLEIGNGGMTDEEYRTHFSLWALLSAPLLAGNDPRHMSAVITGILTNREVIAIDQDSLAAPPRRLPRSGSVEVWMKPLAEGGTAILMLNPTTEAAIIRIPLSDLSVAKTSVVRDLWAHRDLPQSSVDYTAEVPAHGVSLIRISSKRQ
jgi:alpha-galactosidase